MASNSGFTFGLPSGQSKVSNTDEEFRSIKGFVERWTEQEHYATGGSANSAGVHRLGSARVYSGPASQLSNPTGDGGNRLFFTTDTERLYVAQASSSSWSLVSENVQTTSANSWTALQEFSDIKITGAFSGITSQSTTLVASVGADSGSASFVSLNNADFRFAKGDWMIASYNSGPSGVHMYLEVSIPDSNTSEVDVRFFNGGTSRATFVAGTVFRVLGFTV